MGTLTSQPYDVAEGKEWCDYIERVLSECRRLMAEGRMPDSEGIDAFLADVPHVVQQVRRDVTSAAVRGESPIQTSVSMTSEEHKRLISMSESILNLLQILEIRKAVVLDRTPAVGRVAAAIVGGTFSS